MLTGNDPTGILTDPLEDVIAYLGGLAAADGCFTARFRNKHCQWPTAEFVIQLRHDDSEVLAALRDRLGVGAEVFLKRGYIVWTVSSHEDCIRLVSLLDWIPIQGPKHLDYLVWRELVLELLRRDRDPQRAGYLSDLLSEIKQNYSDLRLDEFRSFPRLLTDCEFGHNLAGFLDGDGCYELHWSEWRPSSRSARVVVGMHKQMYDYLSSLAARTGWGRASLDSRDARWATHACDRPAILAFLRCFPSRAKKRCDAELWVIAVEHLLAEGPNDHWFLGALSRLLSQRRRRPDLPSGKRGRTPSHLAPGKNGAMILAG